MWAFLIFAAWLAAAISGAAGFGGALLLLPVITYAVGAKAAIPVLTIAQLLGNVSRAGWGFKEISWRPVLLFSLGAVPLSILGARLFVSLPSHLTMQGIGMFLLLMVAFRHTKRGKCPLASGWLALSGAVVGFLSAVAGSAGPLGAAVFLTLGLTPTAYVASEAVTAVLMHLSKTVMYGRYTLIDNHALLLGVVLGGAMVLGSWSGRKIIQKVPERQFRTFVEVLLILSALLLMFT